MAFFGSCVAVITPFKDDYKIDYVSLHKTLNYLVQHGITHVLLGGTTGEGITLKEFEKKLLYDFARKEFPNLHVMGCYSKVSLYKCDSFAYSSCDSVLVSPQYFIKPNNESIVEFFKEAAQKLAKPIFIYNNPSRFSVSIKQDIYDMLYEIPNIIGIKESGNNDISDYAERYANWILLGGNDDEIAKFKQAKFNGMISAVGNIAPVQLTNIWQDNIDTDNNQSGVWNDLVECVFSVPSPLLLKYALYKKGIIASYITRYFLQSSDLQDKFTSIEQYLS